MAREQVRRIAHVKAEPAEIWARVRDFWAPWHPLVATVVAEEGGMVRAMTMHGEDTVYRERLTWFSDSDMTLAYTHLEGIKGAQSYTGRMTVSAAKNGGTIVTLSAEIEATAARAKEIAEGTAVVFDTGLQALGAVMEPPVRIVERAKQPVMAATQTFDDLPRLALDITPPKDGPLVLFLHGIGGNRHNWSDQIGVAGVITRAAALDLRGYGDSTLGPEQSTVDDYCADIVRVADQLGVGRLILCGLSYGSWIATAFAEKHPERIAGLILSGGCTGMSEAGPDEREAFRISREIPLDAGQSPADFAPTVISAISGPKATDAALSAMQASMAAIPTETYRDALRCFTNPLRTFDFSRLTMPVLMMTGEFDKLAPPPEIRSVAQRIHDAVAQPDVRFEMIRGAGHICNVEAPEAYNAPLLEFLRRIAR